MSEKGYGIAGIFTAVMYIDQHFYCKADGRIFHKILLAQNFAPHNFCPNLLQTLTWIGFVAYQQTRFEQSYSTSKNTKCFDVWCKSKYALYMENFSENQAEVSMKHSL